MGIYARTGPSLLTGLLNTVEYMKKKIDYIAQAYKLFWTIGCLYVYFSTYYGLL